MFITNYIFNRMDWTAITLVAFLVTMFVVFQLDVNGRTTYYGDYGVVGMFGEMFRFACLTLILFVAFFIAMTVITFILMLLWLLIF